MAPELAFHLRRYRDLMNAQRAAEGRPPMQPDEQFFPVVASNRTWLSDLKGAGVEPLDFRNKRLSTNGARKWFQTVLEPGGDQDAGRRTMMIDLMMRHDKDVRSRYFDPSLERQFEFLQKLPRLWPNFGGDGDLRTGFGCEQPPPNPKSHQSGLDNGPNMRQTSAVSSGPVSAAHNVPEAPSGRSPQQRKASVHKRASAIPRDARTKSDLGTHSGLYRVPNEVEDLAELFELIARVIRRSGCHGRKSPDPEQRAPDGAA